MVEDVGKHIGYHKFFESENLNRVFRNMIIKLMQEAERGNTEKEVLLLMRNIDFYYEFTTDFNSKRVTLSDNMKNALYEANELEYTAFHNHPNNGHLSSGDLKMMLYYPKITYVVMCTNNYKHIEILHRIREISDDEEEALVNLNMDFSDECIETLESHGFMYIHRNN